MLNLALALALQIYAPGSEALAEATTDAPAADVVAQEGRNAPDPRMTAPYVGRMGKDGTMFARPETRRIVGAAPYGFVEMWFDVVRTGGTEEKQLWRFWCDRRRLDIVTWAGYDASGSLIERNDGASSGSPYGRDVIPDTIGEDMFKIACVTGIP